MTYLSLQIGALVEYVLAFVALLVVLIVSLVTVHRRNDPLRSPFLWLKVASALFFIWLLIRGIQVILIIVWYAADVDLVILQIIRHLFHIYAALESIADVFILFCLVELALCCLRLLGKDGVYHSIIRYSNMVIMAILFVLCIAALGTGEKWVVITSIGYDPDSKGTTAYWTTSYNLLASYSIIYWVTALVVMFLSGSILFISIRRKHLQSIAYLFFFASLLNLVRSTYGFAFAVLYNINAQPTDDIPMYLYVLDPILYAWFTVAMLGVLVAMGSKKQNGMWSQQPTQQGYGGGIAFHGRPEMATGLPPTHAVYQHRHPTELVAPNYPVELANPGYPHPTQQYYAVQNPQQPPYMQNQSANTYYTSPPAHSPLHQQPGELPVGAANTVPVAVSSLKTEQQSQVAPMS